MCASERTLLESAGDSMIHPHTDDTTWPILICVLGTFRVLQAGQPVPVHGGKTQALLCRLALRYADGLHRTTLLDTLWPDSDAALAAEALRGRVKGLHKLLAAGLGGAAPVLQVDGWYRLNTGAGVGVDVACFDALATTGDRHTRTGHVVEAATAYQRAVQLYHGDLCMATNPYAVVERERLRAHYLRLLVSLATYAYAAGDDAACLAYAQRVLEHDPCREDAHRLVMRCHVRRVERAQALHQYRVCEGILRTTFETSPEPATAALFEQVRLAPASV